MSVSDFHNSSDYITANVIVLFLSNNNAFYGVN